MITNYCCCTWDRPPYHTQYNQVDLLCDSSSLSTNQKIDFKRYGVAFDDDGENISRLNFTFAELTGHYWIWKNSKEKMIAVTHYRRFWIEKKVGEIDDNTIVVIDKINLSGMTAYDQFAKVHGKYGLEIVEDILNTENVRYKKEHFEQLKDIKFLHPCNMFIASKENFDTICDILFEILFKVYARCFNYICNLNQYQVRFMGFLSERILTTIFLNINDYIKDAKLKPVEFEMYK